MLTVLNNLLLSYAVSSAAAVISPGDSTISARSCTRTTDVCLRYLSYLRGVRRKDGSRPSAGPPHVLSSLSSCCCVSTVRLLFLHDDSIVIVLKHFICLLLGARCLFYVVTNAALVRPNVRASYRYAPRRKTFSRPKVRKTII